MAFLHSLSSILVSTIVMSTPLIFAALGGVFSVRSGIMALGLESMMMVGAFSAVVGSYFFGHAWIGFLWGMAGGMALGILHGILSVRYKVNQVISGIGLNLLALAATTLLMQLLWNNRGNSPQVASIHGTASIFLGVPILGEIFGKLSVNSYLAVLSALVSWFVLFQTRFGLRLRMVGENPKAAATMGIRVHKIKYVAVAVCGMLAGFGGAFLSLNHMDMFVRDMTAGRGYIAVAVAILSRYNPIGVIACALLFGFCDALQIYFQGGAIPTQLIQMLPYLVTLLVLTFGVKHIKAPEGVGKYDDD